MMQHWERGQLIRLKSLRCSPLTVHNAAHTVRYLYSSPTY